MKIVLEKINSFVDKRTDSLVKKTRLMVDGKMFRYPYPKKVISDSQMVKKLDKIDSQYKKTYIRTLLVRFFGYVGVGLSLMGLFVSWPRFYWVTVMIIFAIAGLISLSNFILLTKVLRKDGFNHSSDSESSTDWSRVVSLGVNHQVVEEAEDQDQNRLDKDQNLNVNVVGKEIINRLSTFVFIELLAVILFVYGMICYYNDYSAYVAYLAIPSAFFMINCLFWVESFRYYSSQLLSFLVSIFSLLSR
ncbi:hypothetical protein [Fructobacillus evanidus]|uniref:Uncharacterized protein n=1 Tax=Fructobacillus evanidus TaxID=3064281 RepID=A0ABN9YU34_9LACO|nr:unnamed protein product [Fructobacillus sp. LMG 32999]CAK1229565.1 unnamed protein product [Fructobacillus sp. LMG 32999]CAK1231025.1 unnamed protein product [Fructobacillus sp. LMG 32999]CAK1231132.1 unnamed protein product [Fructobacillus sp. LMG 32999]CAK1232232.1 unnamed protein product [Fructobacillus sp. LMG 32999]